MRCKRCVDGGYIWCPRTDDYSRGQCYSTKSNRVGYLNIYSYFNKTTNEYSHPGLQLRHLCSDKIDRVSAKYRKTLKYYTCPYKDSCGSEKNVIVPSYSSTKKYNIFYQQGKTKDSNNKPKAYKKDDICRH